MANVGEAESITAIVRDTDEFAPEGMEEWTIILKFLRSGRHQVKQKGSDAACGFGGYVYASGLYKKVSGKKPRFNRFD